MNWLRRLLPGGGAAAPPAVVLDTERRTEQLAELEQALDALIEAMSADWHRMGNPGWKERVTEYKRQSGTAYSLRRGGFDREQLLDLAFEIRPVGDELPSELAWLGERQDRVMAAAEQLREVLPSEQPSE